MTITEKEIYSQSEALLKTHGWFKENKNEILAFFSETQRKKIIFIGCGSSFMLAKSGEALFAAEKEYHSRSIAGGDFIIAPSEYTHIINDSIVVILSRSGLTSEIVKAAAIIKKDFDAKIVSVTMQKTNKLSQFADFEITLPWAYDYSVCQTRTVTTFYYTLLELHSLLMGNEKGKVDLQDIGVKQKEFLEQFKESAKDIAKRDFTNIVVLADGVLAGIAEEAALVFTEVSLLSGKYFHLLDYRHGPKVLNDSSTLNIVVLRPTEADYQGAMVKDLKEMGGTVIVIDSFKTNRFDVHLHVGVDSHSFPMYGIYLITLCQMIGLEKALLRGINPDKPSGLDAYINL